MNSFEAWMPFVVIWLICGGIASAVARPKGQAGAGFALGVLLGPIGILIAAVMKSTPEAKAAELLEVQRIMGAATSATPAGWWPDPHRKHELRYWDGARWTEHVSNQGVQATDA